MKKYDYIEKKLTDSINYYTDRIALWEAVTFPTKKNGDPFAVLSRNFEGAEIGKYYPVEEYDTPYLTVSGRSITDHRQYGQWVTDHLQIYKDRYNKRLPEHNPDREVRPGTYGEDHEILTLEEIKSEIANLIERYKEEKKKSEHELAISRKKFEKVKKHVLAIRDIIYDSDDIYGTTLEYALQDYVQSFDKYM